MKGLKQIYQRTWIHFDQQRFAVHLTSKRLCGIIKLPRNQWKQHVLHFPLSNLVQLIMSKTFISIINQSR